MKATPRSCAIGFNTRAAHLISSSSTSLRRSCKEATSPPASAASSSFANFSGSSAGGVIRYSLVVARASLSGKGLVFPLIDFDDLGQHVQRLLLRPLEGIAAD